MWPMSMTGLRAESEPPSVTNSEWSIARPRPPANTRGQACCIKARRSSKGCQSHRLGIHARDGRKRQHAAQTLARAGLVHIGKIVLMRKEAPNLGHDILSIVTTKAAPRERALQRRRLPPVICPRDSEERNSRVRWCLGLPKSSAGAASSSTTPLSIKTTRSDTVRAKAISCVTTTMVMPSAASLRMDLEHLAHDLGVERRGRLVKQHDLRIHAQGTSDGHTLLLTTGQATHGGVRELFEVPRSPDAPSRPSRPRPCSSF